MALAAKINLLPCRVVSRVFRSHGLGNPRRRLFSHDRSDIMVVGSMAVDVTCTPESSDPAPYDSRPAKIRTSAGGVAHNVALAASYATHNMVRLLTTVGSDLEGAWLREYAKSSGLDVTFIPGENTAKTITVQDKSSAYCDMKIVEDLRGEDIEKEIDKFKPAYIAFDAYLSPGAMRPILQSDARGGISLIILT
jgi:pseudouridylate synthase / pseudouridine kinase